MSYDVVSAYTLVMGDEHGPATVSLHATAEDAWCALDREVRARCGLRRRPRRVADSGAAARLADAWRAADAEARFWQIRPHQLPVTIPVIGRPAVVARH
jgi:NADH:ubiquinone oxidoreductase subunit H